MFEHPQLEALTAIIRLGSFDAAAAHLAVTPSAVSQRIRQLEERLGVTLVQRGQPCIATPLAKRLISHGEQVRLLEKKLADDLGLSHRRHAQIRIAVTADSLASWLLPALAKVQGFLFDLVIDDQDHSEGWLKSGEVAGAITSRMSPLQGCDCYALGSLRYIATASPEFTSRYFGDGLSVDGFTNAPALTFNSKDRLQRDWAAEVTGERLNLPTHYVASSQGFVTAALLGMGWGMNPEFLVRDLIRDKRLQALAPHIPMDTPLSWQVPRLTAQALEPVTRAIRDTAAQELTQSKVFS